MASQIQVLAALLASGGLFPPEYELAPRRYHHMDQHQRKQVDKRRQARKNQKLAAKRNRSR